MGTTPLQSAVVGRHDDVVELLTTKGADVNRRNQYTTALILALSMSDADGVRYLISNGADVNMRDARGQSPLEATIVGRLRGHEFDDALRPHDQEKMRLLLEAGADVRARAKDEDRRTPLHQAAGSDRDDLAALLIAHGADLTALSESGWTPLHYAAQQGSTAVVEVLLQNGADVNAKTKDGSTPLNLVWGNDAMKTLLERHGGRLAGYR
jgi:ankyrin repeat protein